MTEQTFKVGDKVQALGTRTGVVTYGPVGSAFGTTTMYVAREDGTGRETAFKVIDLAALPAFAVGDKAKMDGEREPVEILAGPYKNRYITWYTVKAEVGETTAAADNLTALPAPALVPVGTRVRVDRAKWAEETHGRIGVVTSNTEDWRADDDDLHPYIVQLGGHSNTVHVAELTPVDEPADQTTFEYAGVTYDVTALYRDNDGDVWKFTDRDERGPHATMRTAGYPDESLRDVVRQYGPLIKQAA